MTPHPQQEKMFQVSERALKLIDLYLRDDQNNQKYPSFIDALYSQPISTPAPAAPSPEKILCCAQCPCRQPDCEDDCKGWQMRNEHDATIRNQTLEEAQHAIDIEQIRVDSSFLHVGNIRNVLNSLRTPSTQEQP